MWDGSAPQCPTNEFNISPFNIGNYQNPHLGQKMQTQFIVGIAQNTLLDEHDIRTTLFDLFAHVENVFPFVAQDAIHGGIVANDDTVVHVCFGGGEAESV